MRRVLLVIPWAGVPVHSFGLMLVLACLGSLYLAAWRARRERLDPEIIHGLVPWVFSGGVIGARVFYLVMNPSSIQHWADIFRVWQGGIVFYGCIVGGLVGSVLDWARRRFPFLATADAVAPALALGIAIGRIGCFLNGCCYGETCDRPWAMTFPAGTLPWIRHVQAGLIPSWATHSLPVHPKQLYAAFAGLALLGLLTAYYPRRRRDGEVMALLMIGYPITRFVVEFYRGDAGGLHAGLTISQYMSVALLALGLTAWRWLSRRPARRHAEALAPAPHLDAIVRSEPHGSKASQSRSR